MSSMKIADRYCGAIEKTLVKEFELHILQCVRFENWLFMVFIPMKYDVHWALRYTLLENHFIFI